MKPQKLLPLVAVTLLGVVFVPASATAQDLPNCSSASSDPDGDGYGWENNSSCIVSSDSQSQSGDSTCVDTPPYDDDWGWNGTASCRLSGNNTDNNNSCIDTPPFDDDWGWDGTQSCRLSGSDGSDTANDDASCVDTGVIGDGWGWNGSESCRIGDNSNGDTGSDTGDDSDGDSTGTTYGTSTFEPLYSVPSDTCLTRQDTLNSNYHDAIRMGDFILATNAWNASAAGNFEWEQCIYANQNGARAGWSYRWGAGGGSNDYNVRSYPELIYGVKSQGEISAPKSVTGLPMRIGGMQDISIRYSFAGDEYGPARPVDASVTPRFPNGTTIAGERNVAVESFLHPADSNGQCSESVAQRANGFSNHTFEIMVWLDSGAERLPSGPGDFVTTITLGGQSYDVYTKNSDRKYTAFVARNPQPSGVINWTDFVRWTQENSHRVVERFGARTNSVQIQDDWCLANILIGNEIWWGDGHFDILEWEITRN